jgi:hypothetical protein
MLPLHVHDAIVSNTQSTVILLWERKIGLDNNWKTNRLLFPLFLFFVMIWYIFVKAGPSMHAVRLSLWWICTWIWRMQAHLLYLQTRMDLSRYVIFASNSHFGLFPSLFPSVIPHPSSRRLFMSFHFLCKVGVDSWRVANRQH